MWLAIVRRAAPFMAACVFVSGISAQIATARATSPRVASLNLCTDELVMLLATPQQIASVTHLARNRHEASLWRVARQFPSNDGSILSVAGMRADIIVTMGGVARDRDRLAESIGARMISLDYPQNIDDIEADITEIAEAIGRQSQGRRLVRAMRQLRASKPSRVSQGAFLSSGGNTHAAGTLGAAWLELAGIETPSDRGYTLSSEAMLRDPPPVVIRSNYRADQASRGSHWLGFRFLDRAPATRVISTDGRLWTCAGPLLVSEIVRLRREIFR